MEENKYWRDFIMQSADNIYVLSTRRLKSPLMVRANELGIVIDEFPFTETFPLHSPQVTKKIGTLSSQRLNVIFTSQHAVEGVAKAMTHKPEHWRIYCTSPQTEKLVAEYFGNSKVAGSADSAAKLAKLIVNNPVAGNYVFFCGDQRRDELPATLKENGIPLEEVIIYETRALVQKKMGFYNAILFFSPLAVQGFFSINTIPAATLCFAIGETTAKEIRSFSGRDVIIPPVSSEDQLLQVLIDHIAYQRTS
jgi:uroporphyrinogen-III synthase